VAERSDITVDWGVFSRSSTRTIEVGAPSTQLVIQDLVDTLRSNTLPAGEADDTLDNMDDDDILESEGKTPVQPGIQSGIVATILNAKLQFAARAGPDFILCSITRGDLVSKLVDEGTQTGGDSNTVLIDSAASFITFGIEANGEFEVFNDTDGSSANVSTVDSGIQITTDGLTGGSDNLFQAGDVIRVVGFATSPIMGSAFTTVSYAASVAPSISLLTTMQTQIADIHGQVQRGVFLNEEALTNGVGYQQSPFNNWSDAVDSAEAKSLHKLFVQSDATVDRNLANFELQGIDLPTIDLFGFDFNDVVIRECSVTGPQGTGNSPLLLLTCNVGSVTDFNGSMLTVTVTTKVGVADGATILINEVVPAIGGSPWELDMGAGGAASVAQVQNISGGMIITNMDNVADVVHCGFSQGQLVIDVTCTAAATIFAAGDVTVINNSPGGIVTVIAIGTSLEVWRDRGLDRSSPKTVTEVTEGLDYDESSDGVAKEVRTVGGVQTVQRT